MEYRQTLVLSFSHLSLCLVPSNHLRFIQQYLDINLNIFMCLKWFLTENEQTVISLNGMRSEYTYTDTHMQGNWYITKLWIIANERILLQKKKLHNQHFVCRCLYRYLLKYRSNLFEIQNCVFCSHFFVLFIVTRVNMSYSNFVDRLLAIFVIQQQFWCTWLYDFWKKKNKINQSNRELIKLNINHGFVP